jgi:tripartite-type tricarboxylate transporter receptor subunit TctC
MLCALSGGPPFFSSLSPSLSESSHEKSGSASHRRGRCRHLAWSWCLASQAAEWPSKPLRVIVPSAAGGSPDIVTRLLGNALSKRLGQAVLVDNRPGAAGNIGMQAVMTAVPDGYTLGYANNATLATNQFLFANLPYDPAKLLPVIGLVSTHSLLVVSPRLPVKTVQELVGYAKQHPGQLTFASGGNGTSGHLGAEMFKVQAGIQALHVPYKGAPQAINDLVAGNVTF